MNTYSMTITIIPQFKCMNSPLYNVDKLVYSVDILAAFHKQENFNLASTQLTVLEGHIGWCVVLSGWLLALLASAVLWQYFQGLYLTLALLSFFFFIGWPRATCSRYSENISTLLNCMCKYVSCVLYSQTSLFYLCLTQNHLHGNFLDNCMWVVFF